MLKGVSFKTCIFCFSNTYTEVETRADVIWKFQRYYMINDYERRVFLPPPLSLPLTFYQFFLFICSRLKNTENKMMQTKIIQCKVGFMFNMFKNFRYIFQGCSWEMNSWYAGITITVIPSKSLLNIPTSDTVITIAKPYILVCFIKHNLSISTVWKKKIVEP